MSLARDRERNCTLLKLIHLTRKTSSETKKVAIKADCIAYVSETKDSTSLHLTNEGNYNGVIVVTEPYEQVLRMWATALADNSN